MGFNRKEILLIENEKEKKLLLDVFKISHKTKIPDLGISLKPYVLLFDEFYTEQYRITEAKNLMYDSDRFIFLVLHLVLELHQWQPKLLLPREVK